MDDAVFSERHGFAPKSEPRSDDYLPPWIREAIVNDLGEFVTNKPSESLPDIGIYRLIRPYIWQVLDREPPRNPQGGPWAFYIPEVLKRCSWWQVYDIIEQIAGLVDQEWGKDHQNSLAQRLNATLGREGIPWRMQSGHIVRAFNPQIEGKIAEARILLTDPKFKGPDEQFSKAIACLNRRPEPDEENSVKDAVGAVEAVANILAGTTGAQLNTLLNQEPYSSGIHATIRKSIEKVYAYRGAAPGAAHGQVGPSIVGNAEATWVLAVSAATILYLHAKFNK